MGLKNIYIEKKALAVGSYDVDKNNVCVWSAIKRSSPNVPWSRSKVIRSR